MTRNLLLIAVGLALGYTIGFRDARVNDQTVVERLIGRVGGHARQQYSGDVDAQSARVDAGAR